MKVAIADDDPIVRSSLSTILTATGAASVLWTAGDGQEALDCYRAADGRPDVLLIDVQMPGMDGLAAAERIIAADRDARILFLTTFADRGYISHALKLGAKGYLIKQDVASVAPALQAVMAGQVVLGSEALARLPLGGPDGGGAVGPASVGAGLGATGAGDGAAREPGSGMQANSPRETPAGKSVDTAKRVPARFAGLTVRDRQIAALVADGLDNRAIAAELHLSEGTVRNRVSAILSKTNLSNRTQLAVEWLAIQ
ncbi:response regulator transcription factor [Bifidobacterium xylocopae]|uniref:DNA-binding response regulator n=1 Tax=Bifidobacterium xylocopae TaxID=2493119 RepID=A0A366KDF3_9BIFI|nr:response regulator transcription factor [Bifidobacterium xylocopae]RBP99734.1 DNA-binding response regulator [Bifidobacterium xylocopae]